MTARERRQAARANQQAAAFVRFQMLGDYEAMYLVLSETADNERARLSFITALASVAARVASSALGGEGALAYLQGVAASSAALSEVDDIDGYFDAPGGAG